MSDCGGRYACGANETVRGLHLGSASNPPESLVRLERDAVSGAWLPVAGSILKPHIQFTLLAFAWLERGFEAESRALLVGVAGGSLLHFWRECVPGGLALPVDAVEYDGAVLEAARAHLGLSACEPPHGRCSLHVKDGAAFLQRAEDEAYDLVVIDLDMGALIDASKPSQPSNGGAKPDGGAPSDAARRRKRAAPADPTRDMYRVLSSRGVLVINEYSEEAPSVRLESSLRLVRLLRRFFPEVHQIRTNTDHNIMLIAPVEVSSVGSTILDLAQRAQRACLGRDPARAALAALVEQASYMPPNRYQVYSNTS